MQHLQQSGFVAEGQTIGRREIFLDSFDWRLFRQNSCLIESRGGTGPQLQWLDRASGNCRAVANVEATPRFAADLPAGTLGDGLRPLLDVRALIPLAVRRVRRQAFKLLNGEDKTVLRLVIEEAKVSRPGRAGEKEVARVIRLLPVKGYDNALRQAVRLLTKGLGLAPSRTNFLVAVFRAAGHEPGGYSSKIDLKIDPAMTAFDATRALLATLWKAAEVNEAGVIADIDTEFLHDFRVAIRRTRSALSQLKEVFSEAETARYSQDFSWLAGVTGPTRDLDVYLLALPGYEQILTQDYRPGVAALKDLILRRRAREFKNLVEVLHGARYRALKRRWHGFLTAVQPPAVKGLNADLPVQALAGQRIWRLYRKLLAGGRAITQASPATDLHELRKMTKKLRYVLEFFKSLYPDKDVAVILKAMKLLQENLGGIQDYEVQADQLAEMATELEASGVAGKECFLAIGMLTAHLIDLQVKAREDFAVVFGDFDTKEMGRIFRKLFKEDAAGARA